MLSSSNNGSQFIRNLIFNQIKSTKKQNFGPSLSFTIVSGKILSQSIIKIFLVQYHQVYSQLLIIRHHNVTDTTFNYNNILSPTQLQSTSMVRDNFDNNNNHLMRSIHLLCFIPIKILICLCIQIRF